MNAKLIYLLLVVTTMTLMFDTAQAVDIMCSGPKQCYGPCKKETGCPNAKCMNRRCKCYGCSG
uniref:Potassium channel toxin n=1 Tax=Urodacus yaschenkoi TaxID=1273102 RepID=A0A0A0PI37_UROYA|nr:potassium channel toxin precursor [Urodacus yaschenkoi]